MSLYFVTSYIDANTDFSMSERGHLLEEAARRADLTNSCGCFAGGCSFAEEVRWIAVEIWEVRIVGDVRTCRSICDAVFLLQDSISTNSLFYCGILGIFLTPMLAAP